MASKKSFLDILACLMIDLIFNALTSPRWQSKITLSSFPLMIFLNFLCEVAFFLRLL